MKQCFNTLRGPKAIGPYSTAVKAGNLVFLSGMIPIVPETGLMAEGIGEQARQAIANVVTVLGEMGLSAEDVVKTTVFLTDLSNFDAVNSVYAQTFGGDCPARSCVGISALPKGALIEIEAIAAMRESIEPGTTLKGCAKGV